MNLGENIYRLRTEKNMSQGDLADALEVSRQSVSKWENNSAVPELEKLVKMAELFEVSLDSLVTGQTETQKASFASRPLTVRGILGSIFIGIGALAVLMLLIFAPEGLFFSSAFFLVGLILLTNFSIHGIYAFVIIYLVFFFASCHSPAAGWILSPLGIGLGYAAARLWEHNIENDEENTDTK